MDLNVIRQKKFVVSLPNERTLWHVQEGETQTRSSRPWRTQRSSTQVGDAKQVSKTHLCTHTHAHTYPPCPCQSSSKKGCSARQWCSREPLKSSQGNERTAGGGASLEWGSGWRVRDVLTCRKTERSDQHLYKSWRTWAEKYPGNRVCDDFRGSF